MIRINLLPTDTEATTTQINPYIIPAFVGVIMVGFIFFDHVRIAKKKARLTDDIADVKQKLSRYEPILRQVEDLERQRAALRSRRDIIQQLHNERLRYPKFMDDLMKLIPPNIWFTNLTTTVKGDALTTRMDVQALDNYAIADFIANLETSQIFSEVVLGPIALAQGVIAPSFAFNISCTYKALPAGADSLATKKP